MYGIYHWFDVDGGFGDSVGNEELIAICETEELAKEYAEKWDCTHVYDQPYSDLYCGRLVVRSLNDILTVTEKNKDVSPWTNHWVSRTEVIERPNENGC